MDNWILLILIGVRSTGMAPDGEDPPSSSHSGHGIELGTCEKLHFDGRVEMVNNDRHGVYSLLGEESHVMIVV